MDYKLLLPLFLIASCGDYREIGGDSTSAIDPDWGTTEEEGEGTHGGDETSTSTSSTSTTDTGGTDTGGPKFDMGGPKFDVAFDECEGLHYRYEVTDAINDGLVSYSVIDHGIWAPDFYCDGGTALFSFEPFSYLDIYDENGLEVARLHGSVATIDDGCQGGPNIGDLWGVDIKMGSTIADPKKELKDPDIHQPAAVTIDWEYWEIQPEKSSMERQGEIAVIYPRPGPYAFQVGWTASGKNLNFGAAGWITYVLLDAAGGPRLQGIGDINVDLNGLCFPVLE